MRRVTPRPNVLLTMLIASSFAVAACGDSSGSSPTGSENAGEDRFELVKSDVERQIPTANDTDLRYSARDSLAFGVEFFNHLTDTAAGDENIAISPVSIRTAFALLYTGADGETKEQIADVFRFDEDPEMTNDRFNALDRDLTSMELPAADGDDAVILRVANSFWPNADIGVSEAYLDTIARHYGAALRSLDYADDPELAREIINNWVSEQTRGLISEALPPGAVEPSTILTLTNTLYLNAPWDVPFEEYGTYEDTFTLADGGTTTAQFMGHTERARYSSGDNWEALELMMRGERLSMLFILPADGEFGDFAATLSPQIITEAANRLSDKLVDIRIPSFKFRYRTILKDSLREMGLDLSSANLSKILAGTGGIDISGSLHETVVSIDESGVEAAAVTAIIAADISSTGEDEPVVRFHAERPFFFVIRDRRLGTPLFIGRMMRPVSPETPN